MAENLVPKISVLMPVYNCISYIEKSVLSVLSQTFADFELIIIDDFSTDGTFEYLQSIEDQRVKLVRKNLNTGLTESLNIGLDISSADYIARMDGDDICLPDRFEKQLNYLESNPDIIMCGGAYEVIGSGEKFIPPTSHDELCHNLMVNCPFAHPTVFVRNEILRKNNIKYRPEYEPAEDYKMWTELSKFGKLANLRDVLIKYRIHTSQTSNLRKIAQVEMSKKISAEYIFELSSFNNDFKSFFPHKLFDDIDVRKFEFITNEIKLGLTLRGVRIDDLFFSRYTSFFYRQSFYTNFYSLKQLKADLMLILKLRKHLGALYIIKHFIKCVLHWTPKN